MKCRPIRLVGDKLKSPAVMQELIRVKVNPEVVCKPSLRFMSHRGVTEATGKKLLGIK